jgi:hypothetical protein
MRRIAIAALALAALAGSTWGQTIPEKIGFQGRLTDATGNPVSGSVNLTFKLYTAGGTEKWSSGALGVTVTGGLYSVELGDAALGLLPFDEAYRLGVTVESDAEMTPRYPLLAVPYAMRAKRANDADMLDGLHAADLSLSAHNHTGTYVRITGDTMSGALALPANGLAAGVNQLVLSGGNVGIGTTTPAAKLDVDAGATATGIFAQTTSTSGRAVTGSASAATGPTYGVYGVSSSTSGTGIFAMANAGSGTTYGLFARSDSTSGYGIYGAATAGSGTTYGVYGSSASPAGWGLYTPNNAHVGGTLSINGGVSLPASGITGAGTGSGLNADLLDGSHASAFASASGSANYIQNQTGSNQAAGFRITGNGIFNGGQIGIGTTSPSASYKLHVSSNSMGAYVETDGTGSPTYAIYGYAGGGNGTTYGVYGKSISLSGYGVYGEGGYYGVYGETASTSGTGLFGRASAATGSTHGVYGECNSSGGRGVRGYATATNGTTWGVHGQSDATSGLGVHGYASAASGYTTGVLGQSNSTNGRGVEGFAFADSGDTVGVYGSAASTSGIGVHGFAQTLGVFGEATSSSGYGILGVATATSGVNFGVRGSTASTSGFGVFGYAENSSGTNYGVYGQSNSTSGSGVYGLAGAGSGTTLGVLGMSVSPDGMGIYGVASATSGTNFGVRGASASTSGFGVFGRAEATSGVTYGVYGECWSASGYAGYFTGTVHATSTISSAVGANLDQADANNGTLSPGLKFGTGGVGEGISSKRTATGNQYGLDFYTRSNVRMSITNDGKVGIGRSASANRLEVEGEASKSAGGVWATNSDARIKEDVETVQNALDVVDRLRPVQFRYTDAYRARHPSVADVTHYNFIAQEFREIFPDYVKGSGEDGMLQVDTYPALICAVAAVKELRAQVATLEARLAALERAAGK